MKLTVRIQGLCEASMKLKLDNFCIIKLFLNVLLGLTELIDVAKLYDCFVPPLLPISLILRMTAIG